MDTQGEEIEEQIKRQWGEDLSFDKPKDILVFLIRNGEDFLLRNIWEDPPYLGIDEKIGGRESEIMGNAEYSSSSSPNKNSAFNANALQP